MKLIATNCASLVVAVSSVLVIMHPALVTEAAAAAPGITKEVKRLPKKVQFESINFDAEDPEFVAIEGEITVVANETAVNIQTNVRKSVPHDSVINIELCTEKKKTPGEFSTLLNSGEVPVCDLLRNATSQPLFHTIIQSLSKFTNLPLQCPIPVGEYWVKGFSVDSALIPDFVPEGRYKVNVAVRQPMPNPKVVYQTEWVFSIVTSVAGAAAK